MSKTTASVLIFVVSMILGVVAAELFYRTIFIPSVPPIVMTNLSMGTSHFSFIIGGLGLGLVMFVWTLLAVGITVAARHLTADRPKPGATPAGAAR